MTTRSRLLSVGILWLITCYVVNADSLAIRKQYPARKVAPHTWVIHGPNELFSKANQGFTNNPVLVKTSKGWVVIDPGGSLYIGEMVAKKTRSLSDKKVIAVFNTHAHGDHWLGNHGITKHFPDVAIYAHSRAKTIIESSDGQNWLKRMADYSKGMSKGTKVVAPNKTVRHGDKIRIGEITFKIHHYGKAHTDHDIMIEIVEDKVLVCGDVLRNHNISVAMASFKGNLATLDNALKTGATIYVPGHGKSGDSSIVKQYIEFIRKLKTAVKKHYDAGLSVFEMKPKIMKSLSGYSHYTHFKDNIGKLIHQANLEVEYESF